jgi:putative ABC transport system permease protein
MNIVNKLTLRHIKTHKRRSLLTILSIIVSVAMITAVFTSVFSFVTFLKDATAAYDGSWQAQLFYDDAPNLAAFKNDGITYYAGKNVFQFTYDKDSNKAKAFGNVDAIDETAVDMRNIHITDGTFPKTADEILISDSYIEKNKLNWKIGDRIRIYCTDFETDERER